MLRLQNCVFYCVYKTGSTWASAAMLRACNVAMDAGISRYHDSPAKSKESLPGFAFIRHPVTWYESYWLHQQKNGWNSNDRHRKTGDYTEFVKRVLDEHPAFMSDYMRSWHGENLDEMPFVGRFENLADDLCKALKHYGEEFDEPLLRMTAPKNQGNRKRWSVSLSSQLTDRIIDSEAKIIHRFYPE